MSRFICAALASAAVAYFGFHATGLLLLEAVFIGSVIGGAVSMLFTR